MLTVGSLFSGIGGIDLGLERAGMRIAWQVEIDDWCQRVLCGHNAYRPGIVLDPFAGSGTTLAVARDLGRQAIGIELSPEYVQLIAKRCAQNALAL